ncbi:hypothetical protein [Fictibacillus sp. JL2B1089]|uniref:hypothetical protein n=1 Tax=Fictibacillus sp. JL2B1089 TaxID=3399565 RepID=UPI003A8A35A7
MDKKYEQVEFLPGSTIDEAVNQLLSYREKGKLATAQFNGVSLYSDTVTMDGAHKAIIGMTKTECDEYLSEKFVQFKDYETKRCQRKSLASE